MMSRQTRLSDVGLFNRAYAIQHQVVFSMTHEKLLVYPRLLLFNLMRKMYLVI